MTVLVSLRYMTVLVSLRYMTVLVSSSLMAPSTTVDLLVIDRPHVLDLGHYENNSD